MDSVTLETLLRLWIVRERNQPSSSSVESLKDEGLLSSCLLLSSPVLLWCLALHGLEDGNWVSLREVRGMEAINGTSATIK